MYPGEVEHIREQERRKTGIEVDNKTWKAFGDLGGEVWEGRVGRLRRHLADRMLPLIVRPIALRPGRG